jgi:penicillin-binding protein 2D
VDARRSPGSSFKPFVYAAAMEKAGFTAATLLDCEPISIRIPGLPNYEPKDYGGTFHNRPLTVREAIKTSCNISAVKANLACDPERSRCLCPAPGIQQPLAAVVSLPLSSETTVLEMTVAQTPFANRGIKSEAIFVTRVEDARGQVLLENKPQQTVVLDEGIAFIMSDMMKDVFAPGGTAAHLAAIINRPAAVKTGTAEDEKSVYIIGYTPT